MSTSGSASTPSGAYSDVHRRSLEDPERFWLDAARDIDWTRAPRQALDDSRAPLYRWFSDGELNTCWNAGKVLRVITDGLTAPRSTIEDTAVLDALRPLLRGTRETT